MFCTIKILYVYKKFNTKSSVKICFIGYSFVSSDFENGKKI